MTIRRLAGMTLAVGLASGAAHAHSPYLLPNVFDATDRDHVTVQGSFTEAFFTPDVAMKSDDYNTVGPDGVRAPITPTYLRDLAVFEAATPLNGTTRISTGDRVGRTSKVIRVDGQWQFLEPGEPVPAGAAPIDMQSLTKAEVYVSRGKPDSAALKPTGKGVEFHALTHPNSIFAGQPARFEVLIDGKPLAGQTVELHRADETYVGKPKGPAIVSDAAGAFAITVEDPGVYLAMTRHRVGPQDGLPARSITYALTFEAIR